MAITIMHIVRAQQALVSMAVLGLMAYVASWWTSHWGQFSPHEINWLIFSSVWSVIAIPVLVCLPWKAPSIAEQTIPKAVLMVLEIVAMLNWFAGFIALSVFLTDRVCFGTVCAIARAGVVLSAFNWISLTGTTVFNAIQLRKRGGFGSRSGPKVEMHQGV